MLDKVEGQIFLNTRRNAGIYQGGQYSIHEMAYGPVNSVASWKGLNTQSRIYTNFQKSSPQISHENLSISIDVDTKEIGRDKCEVEKIIDDKEDYK